MPFKSVKLHEPLMFCKGCIPSLFMPQCADGFTLLFYFTVKFLS